jgi:hypothetical protein
MRTRSILEASDSYAAANSVVDQAEVSVTAIPGGWAVASSFSASPMVFQSGARAEFAGRQLAEAAAKAGLAVEMRIHTRDGQLAMKTLFRDVSAA